MTYFPPANPGAPMPPAPGYPPGGYPPPPRGNGPAVASLVLGILGCVPLITGLLAILFGIIGLRRARQPYTSGKGLAVAGLVLGIVSILFWCSCVGFSSVMYVRSGPARSVTRQYIQDLSTNHLAAAQASAASQVRLSQIQGQRDEVSQWGNLTDVRFTAMYYNTVNGISQWRLTGIASFAQGPHWFEALLIEQNGQWKIERLRFQ